MPGPLPRPVTLSREQRSILKSLVARHTAPQHVAQRAKIILSADSELGNMEIARALRTGITGVKIWRKRWSMASASLPVDTEKGLEGAMIDLLQDRQRSGRPRIFTAQQLATLMSLACENPKKSDRPISHWTHGELAEEAMKRKIVNGISPATVGRFLKRSRPQAAQESLLAQSRQRQS
ncbi:helix-turn-helix domain-containing protein [Candidatus Peregrinibacteria bacterium]|nr:helix-turn-helix domain-containing protein [Candidatus Peregrinibacteria bacterium]